MTTFEQTEGRPVRFTPFLTDITLDGVFRDDCDLFEIILYFIFFKGEIGKRILGGFQNIILLCGFPL